MIYITIINSIALLYLILKDNISVNRKMICFNEEFIGYDVWIFNRHFKLYFRNEKKVELKNEINRLSVSNKEYRKQVLRTKFSWLKTPEQVLKFQEDYSVVDTLYVLELVDSFYHKYFK